MIGLVWVFLFAACIVLPGWIAERRGRSVKLWCWVGFIFGPIAALVVALLPPASEPGGRPPRSALSGLWRRRHGRTFGGRGAGYSRAIVVCATP
jgi:hypothetical protein